MHQVCNVFIYLSLIFFPLCSGLYFHIGETERKCFIEEIPDDTTVIVNYKVELHDPRTGGFMPSSPGIGMHVEVRDPDLKTILSRVYSSQGRISFVSHTPGEHVICLYSNSTKWIGGTQLRIHLNIQVGEHAIDYEAVAQKDKLTNLQLRIRQLIDQVDSISKEQNYQRYREERFRMTSESTHQRVFWWSLAQLVILIGMGAWQLRHLKSFFEAKKLSNKVILLEDLAPCFCLKTQAVISRLQDLQTQGTLTGVIDDRGRIIYISQQELEAVAKFVIQRGRVSISELPENSQKLINLNPNYEVEVTETSCQNKKRKCNC